MILIVDDRQENLFSLKTVLEQHGFRSDTAVSGEEALRKVLQKDYALIILDVQMPVMDGFEVAEALTGLNKTRDIPIIFLSAVNTHKRFITKGFESGAVDYLTKPVDPDILMLKVRNFYRIYEKNNALKEAEKELTATVSELHFTMESLPQLAFTSNRQGEITFVNRQWYLFANTRDSFPETLPGTPGLQEQWLQSISTGTAIEKEVCIKKLDDGQYYYHLLRATPVLVGGEVSRWVGILTSIHEQKMLNETLERKVAERTHELLAMNRELEISNNELQQFTSVASHDLKEPLRKIQFFGSLILDNAGLTGNMFMYLDKIIRYSQR
ncbi:MAG TPA: response regulator, partial [Flavisolibacter sp.]|nr:response regulator [Flavisolibacter sp.]